MVTLKEIQDLKAYLIDRLHANRVKEQLEDEKYVDDTFSIDYLPEGTRQFRTGKAYRMTCAPAEHIVTSTPQAFRDWSKKGDAQSAERIGQECNRWLRVLLHQQPQPFKEYIRKLLGKGEGYIYLQHNETFEPNNPYSLPFRMVIPDPTVIFIDTEAGEVNGVPNRIIIAYGRVAQSVKYSYPDWSWKNQKTKQMTDTVPFWMYWDKDVRYFEADEEPLLNNENGQLVDGSGIQQNEYGFVPIVHAYSGFGEGSPTGDPETMAMSRIRKVRDLIGEYTAIRSVINTQIFKFANPPLDFFYDPQIWTPPDDFATNYKRSLGAFNLLPKTGAYGGFEKGTNLLPDAQLFQHLYNVEKQINEEDPLSMIGQAIGTSGRQQLDAEASALRRFDSVVENAQHAFEVAFSLAMKMCDMKSLDVKPEAIHEGDFKEDYSIRIELKAEDPVANQIKSADGDRKYIQGIIDLETNLTDYQGYTQEQAQKIIAKRMVDDVTINDPIVRRLIAIQTAREMGMEDQYRMLEQQFGQMEKGMNQAPAIGSKGGEPRLNNIKTQTGMEQMDMALAQRPTRLSPGMGI